MSQYRQDENTYLAALLDVADAIAFGMGSAAIQSEITRKYDLEIFEVNKAIKQVRSVLANMPDGFDPGALRAELRGIASMYNPFGRTHSMLNKMADDVKGSTADAKRLEELERKKQELQYQRDRPRSFSEAIRNNYWRELDKEV